jgi:homoserine dehydrogenase
MFCPLTGVGLVGSSVISQIISSPTLRQSLSIVALQNSKKLLLSPSSSTLSSEQSWKSALQSSSESAKAPKDLIPTLTKIQEESKKHTVVIDNTSNDDVASAYPDFLKAGFSIVTPNKKAYSGSKQLFDNIISSIQPASSSQKPPLIYLESTVGAGLPIISTLKDLIATGDEIVKIEGVLSGTLSYIFNVWCPASLDSTDKFSDVVKVAKDNGYTVRNPEHDSY